MQSGVSLANFQFPQSPSVHVQVNVRMPKMTPLQNHIQNDSFINGTLTFLANPGYLAIMNLKRRNMIILNYAKWRSSGEPSIPMFS